MNITDSIPLISTNSGMSAAARMKLMTDMDMPGDT
jgi:hypothetical protein